MITNFENITYDLTPDERRLLPLVYQDLKIRDRSMRITGAQLCAMYDGLTEPRLRFDQECLDEKKTLVYRDWLIKKMQ